MSKRHVLLVTAPLLAAALVGCSGQSGNNAAAANAGAPVPVPTGNAVREAVAMQPGEWEVTLTGDGMPARPPIRICITPEDSARGAEAMVGGGSTTDSGLSCDRSGISLVGGRITGTSTCSSDRLTATVAMDGNITPTAFDVRQRINTTIAGQSHERNIHNVGRRLGECQPGQAEAQARMRAAAEQGPARERAPHPVPVGNAQ